nr:MAG TPA: hypothetical protein [Caudoviricetes sp.]
MHRLTKNKENPWFYIQERLDHQLRLEFSYS